MSSQDTPAVGRILEDPRDTASDAIAGIDSITARFALPVPVLVGKSSVTHREYTFVRVHTTGDYYGKAYAISYGMPVAAVIESALDHT